MVAVASEEYSQRDPWIAGLVSVIIPVFNRERLIGNSITSVLQQSYPTLEIICVDDSSQDNSRDVIEKHAKNYPSKVKYVRNNRKKGVSGARNTGLDVAQGEFVAFLDSDDLYKTFHIERSVSILTSNPDIDWTFADFERWKNGVLFEPSVFASNRINMDKFQTEVVNGVKRRAGRKRLLDHIYYEGAPGLHTSVIRHRAIEGLNFDENLDMFEDWKFRFDAIRRGLKVGYVEDVHHEYHIHEQNLCSMPVHDSAKNLRKCAEHEKLLKIIMTDPASTRQEKAAMRRRVANDIFWNGGYAEYVNGNPEAARFLMEKAVSIYPWDIRIAKTYGLSFFRRLIKGVVVGDARQGDVGGGKAKRTP